MLTAHSTPSGQLWWRSPRLYALGVPHAFLSRAWNIQTPADAEAALSELGLPPRPVHLGVQCHGRKVTTPKMRGAGSPIEADAHVTRGPVHGHRTEYVAVRTADCVPVLLASANGQLVAAVHAGWRGLVAGVLQAAARAMEDHGGPAACAAIGPCISTAHYEIGEEVATQFSPTCIRRDLGPKPHLDLRAATLTRLINAGLKPETIDVSDLCTHANQEHCFSYRRDGRSGHHAALISPRPPNPAT